MERFMKGDVVVLPFPFSDLTASKRRPALVVAGLKGDDIISCQITSESRTDSYSIILEPDDFKKGKLNVASRIRPNRLFTADRSIILYKVGTLKVQKVEKIEEALIKIIKNQKISRSAT